MLARVFLSLLLILSVVWITFTNYPRRQNTNYVEKDGAMVDVPELHAIC